MRVFINLTLFGQVDAEGLPQLGQNFHVLLDGGLQNGGLNLDKGLRVRGLGQFLERIDVVVGNLTRSGKVGNLELVQRVQEGRRIGRQLLEEFLIELWEHWLTLFDCGVCCHQLKGPYRICCTCTISQMVKTSHKRLQYD